MMYELYNGDCLEVMNNLIEEGVKVDMVLLLVSGTVLFQLIKCGRELIN